MNWRRRKKTEPKALPIFIGRLLVYTHTQLIALAAWLQRKTSHYSNRKRKAILAIFCTTFVSVSLSILLEGLKKRAPVYPSITPILAVPLVNPKDKRPLINEAEFKVMHRFRVYLDSLNRTPTGRHIRDSLLQQRPHLLDTIHYLERIYKPLNEARYEKQTPRK